MTQDLKKNDWSTQTRRGMSATEIVAALAQLDGWRLQGDGADLAIEKTYRFANYYQTMAFVNALAFVAHAQDHHPDLSVHYDRCVVSIEPHDAEHVKHGGVRLVVLRVGNEGQCIHESHGRGGIGKADGIFVDQVGAVAM